MDSLTLLKTHWVAAMASSILLYSVVAVIYRLYLSPLSKFPGPKLAAATLLYEAYYDVILGGQYTFKIKELHEQYGGFVRSNLTRCPSSRSRPDRSNQSIWASCQWSRVSWISLLSEVPEKQVQVLHRSIRHPVVYLLFHRSSTSSDSPTARSDVLLQAEYLSPRVCYFWDGWEVMSADWRIPRKWKANAYAFVVSVSSFCHCLSLCPSNSWGIK